MTSPAVCPHCGTPRPADIPPGPCPGCLLKLALDSPDLTLTREGPGATAHFSPGVLDTIAQTIGPVPRVLLRDTMPGEEPSPLVTPADTPPDPSVRYRIDGEIARGGMGAILKGRDPDLNRDVALKVLREDLRENPDMVRRFVEEAQIGGQLQHPGIVPIYELGTFADRRPFFSMKLVKGRTFAAILGERAAPDPAHLTRDLVTLFNVAQTMAYAHARGVIHRDLKPSNIMVGSFGEVQVMDWGLAKVLPRGGVVDDATAGKTREETVIATARSGEADSDLSRAGSVMGTPAYMAPEQARGETDQIDERADVFALGSILCEILTGQPAFTGRTSGEIQRRAGAADLRDAFARLDASRADAEIINVAREALAPQPDERPRDASAFSARLAGYLASMEQRMRTAELERAAESARAEEASARIAEERRKRKWQLGLAASVAAFTLLGAVGLSIFASIVQGKNRDLANANTALAQANADLTAQRQRAEQREQQAIDAVKRFRDAVADNPELKNNPSLEDLRKTLLKEPLAFFKTLREQLQADNDTQPEVLERLASAAFELGNLSDEIGDKQDARRAYEAALVIFQKLANAHPTVTEYQRDLARNHAYIGILLSQTGQRGEARRAFEAALAIKQRIANAHPNVTEYQRDLAASHLNLGNLLFSTSETSEARRQYEASLAILQTLANAHPTVTEYQRDLAASHGNLGKLLHATGQPAEARPALEAALAILQTLADAHPTDIHYQSGLAIAHHDLGVLLSNTGQPAEARREYETSLAVKQRIANAHPTVTEYQRDLAASHLNLGVLLSDTNQPVEERRAYEAALAILQKLADANPTVTAYQSDLEKSHFNLGRLLFKTGETVESQREYETALAIRQKLADAHPTEAEHQAALAGIHNNLGGVLGDTGQPAEARRQYEASLAILQTLANAHPTVTEYQRDLAASHGNLGKLLYATGQPAEARQALDARRVIFQELADSHPDVTQYQSDLGSALSDVAVLDIDEKRFDEARAHLRQAIIRQKNALAANPTNPQYRQSLRNHFAGLILAASALGDQAEVAEAERELAELAASDPAKAALDKRLAAVIGGEPPKDNSERLELARHSYDTQRFRLAARLWGETLQSDPKLADDRESQHAYNAACSAALAAAGKGQKEPPLDDEANARLRSQARAWLHAELAAWTKLLESASTDQKTAIAQTLAHWQQDPDLASLRGESALTTLPAAEREDWELFWNQVGTLLTRAQAQSVPDTGFPSNPFAR